MSRRDEIAFDLMAILQKIYGINSSAKPSEKQEELIETMVNYLDENLSLRRKQKDSKEKECSTKSETS